MAKKKAKARSKSTSRRLAAQKPSRDADEAAEVSSDAGDAGREASADDYLDPSRLATEADESMVVVADFDPANPGQELAEPTKVIKPNDRLARKAEQRQNLEK